MASGSSELFLGKYRLLRRIAVGGMAEIYEAAKGDERVALKILLPQQASDPEVVRAIENEARIQSELDHPNLVRLLEFGTADGHPYLALELVDGHALSELLEGGPIEPGLAILIARSVLDALEHVHARGVVHRDVTPHNVLISKDGRVCLGDFGIARSPVSTKTTTGVIKGKLQYLAPEQATSSTIDARTDLFCAGLILFEMLTGQPYVQGESEVDLIRAAEAPTWRAPSLVAGVDPAFDPVIRRALERFPEQRHPSARFFREELDRIAEQLSIERSQADLAGFLSSLALPVVRELPAPLALARTPRKRRSLLLLLLLPLSLLLLPLLDGGEPMIAPRDPPILEPAKEVLTPPAPPVAPVSPDLPTAKAAPKKSRARRSAPPPPRAVDAPDTPPPIEAPVSNARVRLTALTTELARRKLSAADLSVFRAGEIERAIREQRWEEADRILRESERALATLAIDGPFIQRKMSRVHRLIERTDRTKIDRKQLDALTTAALQDQMEGRYESANARLEAIVELIDRH